MELLTEFILFVFISLLSAYFLSQRKPKNYPPGPYGFPIVGHLPLFGTEPYKTFMNWRSKYGPIIAVNFGSFKSLVVSDAKIMREMLNDNDFAGRPGLQPMMDRSGGIIRGLIFTQGNEWVEQRRFTLKNLRDLGFGRKSMEGIIQDEVTHFLEDLKKENGQGISTKNRFNGSIVNALWQLLSGERFDRADPNLNKIIATITQSFEDNNSLAAVSMFIPWLGKYFPNISGYNKMMGPFYKVVEFIGSFVEEHKRTHVPGSPRDFIDVYLDEMVNTKNPSSSFHKENGADDQLKFLILDLFIAGAETTSTTLTWACLMLAVKQDIQKKIQAEIKNIVGDSRLPSLADRPEMPYTEAFLQETLRFSSLVPFGVFHNTSKATKLAGYDIPKDTMIITNLYACLHDEKIWGDPAEIRPERFLSKDGKSLVRHDALMAFSAGKRVCPGENLARDEFFLFLTGVLQSFSILPDPKSPQLNFDKVISSVLMPKSHNLVFKPRN